MKDDATNSGWRIEVDSEAATAALAADLASLLRGGDVVALSGELGVGKTVFARALIRAIARNPEIEAPSPSFTLMQVYEGDFGKIVHADFYRIEAVHELAELGWEDVVQDAIVIVEWPERSKEIMDADHLDVSLNYASEIGPDARIVTVAGHGVFAKRLESFKSLRQFLRQAGWDDARRDFLQGDASSRSYETLTKPNGERAILMISPARPDGPPIRFGRSYSAIARLAENIRAFVAIAEGLAAQGFSAPKIIARDLDAGLAIVEDLGREGLVDANGPIPERYDQAVEALALLHSRKLPAPCPCQRAAPTESRPMTSTRCSSKLSCFSTGMWTKSPGSSCLRERAPSSSNSGARYLAECLRRRSNLDIARFPLPEPPLASRARWRAAAGRHRFSGLRHGAPGL